MLKHRLIFGTLLVLLLLVLMYADGYLDHVDIEGTWLQSLFRGRTYLPAGLILLGVLLVMIALMSRELSAIFRAKGIDAPATTLTAAGMVGCVLIYVLPQDLDSQLALAIYATALVAVFITALLRHSLRKQRTEGAVGVAGAAMFALIYMGTLPGFYLAIRQWHAVWVIAAVILITKSCDIGAYFTGRAVGRRKLIPWLSPGKTWEGLVGGVVVSGLAAMALTAAGNAMEVTGYWARIDGDRVFVQFDFPLVFAFVAGLLLGVVGQMGDLTASLFKRDAGVKDSGRTIPGFGGLMDVFDSPLAVAPVAYWLLQLVALLHGPG
ncbi:phosphatidate cytidylyltransferase [Phycisphaerales bacterium AB-hyl4]|uniref:Phosphatidate cytidylyltransferase n=1 Tax=Natronomicrosphaera hydrolytica TaxID=3242702 RepID=A0ABV4UBJ8_9BACT